MLTCWALPQNSGCLGGCAKTTSDAAVERSSRRHERSSRRHERSSRRHISRRESRGYSLSRREWWVTSSDEMDNNFTNSRSSQRSNSSVSGIGTTQDGRNSNNNTSNGTTFVNHGKIQSSAVDSIPMLGLRSFLLGYLHLHAFPNVAIGVFHFFMLC
mgnify:CR=1 FL=1